MNTATKQPLLSVVGIVLASAGLVLSACGDDGTDTEAILDEVPSEVTQGDETSEPDEPADDGRSQDVRPLSFLLPAEGETPSGHTRIPASCAQEDGYGAWLTFAVPEGWEATGRSGGGSGSPLGDSVDLRFRTDDGEVEVAQEPDSRQPNGPVLDSSGEPFESFDYEYTRGDETTVITFDAVGTVSVGEQQAEVFVAAAEQAPDVLSSTTYKVRLETAEIPNPAPGDDDGIIPASTVVTITHDPDDGALSEDTVTDIIGSFAIPECTREQVTIRTEVTLGVDVDGDGDVSTVEDLRS